MANGNLLAKLRNQHSFQVLWNQIKNQGFVGRCWGSRSRLKQSRIPGSNIVLCDGNTISVIFEKSGSPGIQIKHFVETDKPSNLSNKILHIIEENQL